MATIAGNLLGPAGQNIKTLPAMLPISQDILTSFDEILKKREVPARLHIHYRKWLRYFFDFCHKYSPPDTKSEQVQLFIDKLDQKNRLPNFASRPRMMFLCISNPGNQGKIKSIMAFSQPRIPLGLLIKCQKHERKKGPDLFLRPFFNSGHDV